ncbi:MAG: hypothetical protein L0387_44815 [Acidobacteria bacterium]|nr:hypothetical protein [Acidobacteriota bacterium]
MLNRVNLEPGEKLVSFTDFKVSNADLFAVLVAQPESKREQTALDVIAVGSAAMRRVQTTIDVDFVEKRFEVLANKFDRALTAFEKHATDALTKRFSPTESGSYTKHIADLVSTAKKDVHGCTVELAKSAKDLLDPDKKTSATGRFEELIQGAAQQFEEMFDPDVKGSYAARLNEHLSSLFGGDGRKGVLGSSLQEALQPILRELQDLKGKIEARKAAEEVIAVSNLKGRPFEEHVHCRLAQLAEPYGDDVLAVGSGSNGSRAGDFLVTVNGSGKRLVVEARDRRQMSLPAIKTELERQQTERDADFALYVSSGQEMLPQHVGDFQIFEDKIITTITNLHIGYRMARLLAVNKMSSEGIDAATLRSVLEKAKDAAASLRNVKSKATSLVRLADGIHNDAEAIEDRILELLDEAEETLMGNSGS